MTLQKTGTQHELETPLKLCVDCHGHKTSNKLVEKKIRSHVKEFIRTINGDKKMKHKKRNAGTGVSSLKSDFERAMGGGILKVPKFAAIRKQHVETNINSLAELIIPTTHAPSKTPRHFPTITTKTSTAMSDKQRQN